MDAPPCQSHKFNGAWGLSWGFRRGAYESNRSAGVSLLFSPRWYRQGHLRRVCCPPLPLSGRCGAAVVKNGLGDFCFIVLYLLRKPSGRGEPTPWNSGSGSGRRHCHTFQRPFYVDTQLLCHRRFIWLHHILWFERTITNRFCCHTLLCNSRASLSSSRLEGGYSCCGLS